MRAPTTARQSQLSSACLLPAASTAPRASGNGAVGAAVLTEPAALLPAWGSHSPPSPSRRPLRPRPCPSNSAVVAPPPDPIVISDSESSSSHRFSENNHPSGSSDSNDLSHSRHSKDSSGARGASDSSGSSSSASSNGSHESGSSSVCSIPAPEQHQSSARRPSLLPPEAKLMSRPATKSQSASKAKFKPSPKPQLKLLKPRPRPSLESSRKARSAATPTGSQARSSAVQSKLKFASPTEGCAPQRPTAAPAPRRTLGIAETQGERKVRLDCLQQLDKSLNWLKQQKKIKVPTAQPDVPAWELVETQLPYDNVMARVELYEGLLRFRDPLDLTIRLLRSLNVFEPWNHATADGLLLDLVALICDVPKNRLVSPPAHITIPNFPPRSKTWRAGDHQIYNKAWNGFLRTLGRYLQGQRLAPASFRATKRGRSLTAKRLSNAKADIADEGELWSELARVVATYNVPVEQLDEFEPPRQVEDEGGDDGAESGPESDSDAAGSTSSSGSVGRALRKRPRIDPTLLRDASDDDAWECANLPPSQRLMTSEEGGRSSARLSSSSKSDGEAAGKRRSRRLRQLPKSHDTDEKHDSCSLSEAEADAEVEGLTAPTSGLNTHTQSSTDRGRTRRSTGRQHPRGAPSPSRPRSTSPDSSSELSDLPESMRTPQQPAPTRPVTTSDSDSDLDSVAGEGHAAPSPARERDHAVSPQSDGPLTPVPHEADHHQESPSPPSGRGEEGQGDERLESLPPVPDDENVRTRVESAAVHHRGTDQKVQGASGSDGPVSNGAEPAAAVDVLDEGSTDAREDRAHVPASRAATAAEETPEPSGPPGPPGLERKISLLNALLVVATLHPELHDAVSGYEEERDEALKELDEKIQDLKLKAAALPDSKAEEAGPDDAEASAQRTKLERKRAAEARRRRALMLDVKRTEVIKYRTSRVLDPRFRPIGRDSQQREYWAFDTPSASAMLAPKWLRGVYVWGKRLPTPHSPPASSHSHAEQGDQPASLFSKLADGSPAPMGVDRGSDQNEGNGEDKACWQVVDEPQGLESLIKYLAWDAWAAESKAAETMWSDMQLATETIRALRAQLAVPRDGPVSAELRQKCADYSSIVDAIGQHQDDLRSRIHNANKTVVDVHMVLQTVLVSMGLLSIKELDEDA